MFLAVKRKASVSELTREALKVYRGSEGDPSYFIRVKGSPECFLRLQERLVCIS